MQLAKKEKAPPIITTENLLDPDFTVLKFYEEWVEERYKLSLIPEFLMLNFKSPAVKRFVGKKLPVLLNKDDLNIISSIASSELMYSEDTFWKQIKRWKEVIFTGENAEQILVSKGKGIVDEYYIGDPTEIGGAKMRRLKPKEIAWHKESAGVALQCLKAVEEGFSRCIHPPSPPVKGKGRPHKEVLPIPRRITAEEYVEWSYKPFTMELKAIEKQLKQKYKLEARIKERKEAKNRIKAKVELAKAHSEMEKAIKEIASALVSYASFSNKEINGLSKSSSLKGISKAILARKHSMDVKTLENRLTEEKNNPLYFNPKPHNT